MKRIVSVLIAVAALAGGIANIAPASGDADGEASPIYGVKIPAGYRDWRLISVDHLAGGSLKQVRAELGNDIAIKSFREGKLPFPIVVGDMNMAQPTTPTGEQATFFHGLGSGLIANQSGLTSLERADEWLNSPPLF